MPLTLLCEIAPLLFKGAMTTLELFLCAACISLVIGTFFGIMRSKNMRVMIISSAIDIATGILRGIPFYVQLLLAYFVVPEFIGFNFSAFTCASVSLGLCSASYMSQIMCANLDSIPEGQWEASKVLGYSQPQALRCIIMPQVLKKVLLPLNGELDQLLKSTSILSSIGVMELTRAALNSISIHMQPVPIYLSIALIYLMMSVCLQTITALVQRRLL